MQFTKMKNPGLWIALSLIICSPLAVAQDNHHLAQAIMNAQAASRATTGEGVAEHAQMALTHAQAEMAADHPSSEDTHVNAAIVSLNDAIEQGHEGHVNLAQKAAREAKSHLKAAR